MPFLTPCLESTISPWTYLSILQMVIVWESELAAEACCRGDSASRQWTKLARKEGTVLRRVRLSATPRTVARQAPLSMASPGKNTGVGCHALLQGILPTQGWNPGLRHCRWILYCLSHERSPKLADNLPTNLWVRIDILKSILTSPWFYLISLIYKSSFLSH